MENVYERIWRVMERDPGNRGLTRDLPRADLHALGLSLLEAGEVFILSGFPVQRADGRGETDGPVGAANLAAVLTALGKKAAVITDEASCAAMLAACSLYAPQAEVLCVPHNGAQAFCYHLIKQRRPTHVIAIERPGRGADGHFHNFRGEPIDDLLSDTDLFLYAQGVTTVGIGDGGNELGMGALRREIEGRVPMGQTICADAPADYTLTAGVSNWWGWGVRAVLSAVTGQDLMPSDEEERRLLRAVVGNGCVDGVTGLPELTVDHLSLEENLSVLWDLREALALPDLSALPPETARRLFREKALVRPTSGMCAGYRQLGLAALPPEEAAAFRTLAGQYPCRFPIAAELAPGQPLPEALGREIDLSRDLPRYRVLRAGLPQEEPLDATPFWREDLTVFLLEAGPALPAGAPAWLWSMAAAPAEPSLGIFSAPGCLLITDQRESGR